MPRARILQLPAVAAAISVLLMLGISCAGSGRVSTAPATIEPDASDSAYALPSPSELRATTYWATDLVRDGSAFAETWPHRHVEATGPSLVFSPNWNPEADPPVAEPAVAVYGFDLDAYDRDPTVRLTWIVPKPDFRRVWIGLGNMARDVWEWQLSSSTSVVEFDPDTHFDDHWRMTVAVVVTGDGPCELASVRLGDPQAWWFRTWGGAGFEHGRSIELGPDDTLYVGGVSGSFDPGDSYDAFVAKFDRAGNAKWQRAWGTPGSWDEVTDLAVSPEGDVFLAGRVYPEGESEPAIMAVKLSSDGTAEWQRAWQTPGGGWGRGIGLDAEGSVYITGEADFKGNELRHVIPLLKYDSDGELLWQVAWDNETTDIVYGLDLAVDTRLGEPFIYVAGASRYFEETWYDIVLLKFDADGNLIWQRTWGYPETAPETHEFARGIGLDASGNVFINGSSTGIDVGTDIEEVVVLKFNPDGDLLWSRQWGTPEREDYGGNKSHGSAVDKDGNLYFTTRTYGVPEKYSDTLALVKYDPLGNFLFQLVWAEINPTCGRDLVTDGHGVLYIAGSACKANGCWYMMTGAISTSPAGWVRPSGGYTPEIEGTVAELAFELAEPPGIFDAGGGEFDMLVMKYTP